MQSLAAAGDREGDQPDIGEKITNRARHLGQLGHHHAFARVQVEHQTRCRARI
ncbi:Uncharacterised protein [Mycobacterium tuberculosis]|nr:Uncharacterised protein [Mycobacterium tuberculosis]